MKKTSFLLVIVLVLLMLSRVGTSMAENCAQAYGGVDQDKLIKDIAKCEQKIRAHSDQFFQAYLTYEPCNIATWSSTTGPKFDKTMHRFKQCMTREGWNMDKYPPESDE